MLNPVATADGGCNGEPHAFALPHPQLGGVSELAPPAVLQLGDHVSGSWNSHNFFRRGRRCGHRGATARTPRARRRARLRSGPPVRTGSGSARTGDESRAHPHFMLCAAVRALFGALGPHAAVSAPPKGRRRLACAISTPRKKPHPAAAFG